MKKEFTYRKLRYILFYMLVLGIPFIIVVPTVIEQIEGPMYWAIDLVLVIVFIFVIWSIVGKLPGVTRKGYYYKDDGRTVLEYEGKTVIFDSVTEVMITDRHASSKGINISIKNQGKRVEFLSEVIGRDTDIEDTSFSDIFFQILAENPHLEQEKDIWGEPIDYWYKAKES